MSVMWSPGEALWTAEPAADVAVDQVDRRLRAQVWGTLLAANVVLWAAGLWFIGSALF